MAEDKNIDKELEPILSQWLPVFDKIYQERQIEISQRPFHATYSFIENAISDIKNCTKEQQLQPPWFGYWYDNIYNWYLKTYGNALKNKIDKDVLISFTIINMLPYIVKIPNKIKKKGDTLEEYKLIFPNKVFKDEKIENWIQNAPINIQRQVITDIKAKANCLRNIWENTLITNFDEEKLNSMLKNILDHLRIYAEDIIINFNNGYTNSIWEIHIAVEKAIKLNLFDKSGDYPKIHNLKKLIRLFNIKNAVKIEKDLSLIDIDPIKYRYGELMEKDISFMNRIYFEAIEIIDNSIMQIHRNIKINNLELTIKNPYYKGN